VKPRRRYFSGRIATLAFVLLLSGACTKVGVVQSTGTSAADSLPPSVPQGVTVAATSPGVLTASWQESTDSGGAGVGGYRVYRDGALISGSSAISLTSYVDSGLAANTTYTYTVVAVDNAGNGSGASTPVSQTTMPMVSVDTTAPSIPAMLRATSVTATQIDLAWDASTDTGGSGMAGYRVYRDDDLVSGTGLVAATVYASVGLAAGKSYAFTVRAVDGAGNVSADSNRLVVSTANDADTTAPSVPATLSGTAVSNSQINLTWTASTDTGGSGLAGYRVYRGGTLSSGTTLVTGNTYNDTGLAANTPYAYYVRAVDRAGNVSANSNTVTVTTKAASSFGMDTRPSNSSCLAPNEPVAGSGYAMQRVFPNRTFPQALKMLQAPGDATKWYVVEQTGIVQFFNANDTNGSTTGTFIDLSGIIAYQGESGLLGMAFHPNYASNGYVYLSYTVPSNPVRTVIARYTRAGSVLDPSSALILLTTERTADHHAGGAIAFGPDGYLYIGLGDSQQPFSLVPPAPQDRHNFFGKMLRIDVDHTTQGADYAIPAGNPYAAGSPALCRNAPSTGANCPEIYAYGFRNPFSWSFDRSSTQADLWVGDVGESSYEEVDRVIAGGNYGWPIREGMHDAGNNLGNTSGDPLTDPVAEYSHAVGGAIIGGYVYRGSALPQLAGKYVYADFVIGDVAYYSANPSGGYDRTLIQNVGTYLTSVNQDNAGELYVTTYGNSAVYRLTSATGSSGGTVASNLANTGCFASLATQTPASGLIPYTVNSPFWSDGAAKNRWMALPDGTTITVASDGHFVFPPGTVLVKNFYLGGKIIETRLFMRYRDTGNWGGYTYQWNAAQNAATLVNGGLTTRINGQNWVYPSSAQCLECHTSAAGYALGTQTAQLNGSFSYPATGRTANQIDTLAHLGLFSAAMPAASTLPALPDPFGTAAVSARARSYLHSNCSQCHRPGTQIPVDMDLRFDTAMSATRTCNVAPSVDDLGIAGAVRIAPQDISKSLIYQRMNRRGTDQMPPLATNVIHSSGVALIQQWIMGMDANCN
jgi:uncharacterized repeat protein (TIGR03806 family)